MLDGQDGPLLGGNSVGLPTYGRRFILSGDSEVRQLYGDVVVSPIRRCESWTLCRGIIVGGKRPYRDRTDHRDMVGVGVFSRTLWVSCKDRPYGNTVDSSKRGPRVWILCCDTWWESSIRGSDRLVDRQVQGRTLYRDTRWRPSVRWCGQLVRTWT